MENAIRSSKHLYPTWLREGGDFGIRLGHSQFPDLKGNAETFMKALNEVETFSTLFRKEVSWLRGKIDEEGQFLVGGDHAETLKMVDVMPRSVLIWDAHLDFRKRYPHEHACVSRRLREMGKDIMIWGVRSYSEEEYEEVDIEFVHAHEPIEKVLDWIDMRDRIYLSVDVDVFPWPSLYPEAGGVDWRDAVTILKALEGKLVGADIVEFKPEAAYQAAGLFIHILGLWMVQRF